MSATSGGGGSVSEGSEAGGSSQSTMSVSDSPSTSFQANLVAENVTKITLSEENSAGGYVADMTGSKVNLTLDDRQQKDGIVNVAFEYEEGANRGGVGGVGGVGGGAGDGFRSMNGSDKKDKVSEAVNLELVNMVPYSNGNGTSYGVPVNGIPGIPMKKDSEQVDMSTPYDEYFVPVNEHKKYMRGEKLYVTKDKRRPTSWRRCLSWVVACTVISVVLIVAILAGTGVILSQEPDLVKDASVGRNFAGSNLKPSVTENSFTPTAEKLMYVPRSIESEFVIDNLDFDPALRDLNSSAYQQFTTSMEDQLKMLLFDKETLEFGASDIGVKVVNISRDPFKVNYRIGWNYKQGVNNPPEPIKMEDVKRRLVESLARNQGYIDKYHIDREAIKVNHVINACQMENGGCSHICYYNYITQQFTCTCPTHLVLDSTGKNCIAWSGSEDDVVPIPSHGAYPGTPNESTANPSQEYEYNENGQSGVQQGAHHHKEVNAHDSADSDRKSHMDEHHGDREPTPEPAPEPTAEPGSIQQDRASADLEIKPQPAIEDDGKKTYDEEHDHDMHTVPNIDGVHSHYELGQSNIHSSQETSGPESGITPTAEPTSEDKYHDYAVHHISESDELAPEPSLEPGLESTANKDRGHTAYSPYESKDHELAAEPTPEPAPEPTPEPSSEKKNDVHSVYEAISKESVSEPSRGRGHQDFVVHTMYESKGEEPSTEPISKFSPESTVGPDVEGRDRAGHSFYDSKSHEPASEPTPTPASNPAANSTSEDKDQLLHILSESKDRDPVAEPTPEPTPEPGSERNAESKDHEGHLLYESKEHEPSGQPTLNPALESTVETSAEGKSDDVHTLNEFKDKPATEAAADSSLQDLHKEHDPHFISTSKEISEPVTEASFEGSNKGHGTHFISAPEDSESSAEPKAESSPEYKNKETGDHSIYETKNATTETTAEPNLYAVLGHKTPDHFDDQTTEHSPKLSLQPILTTSESTADNIHQTLSPNADGSENTGSTGHLQLPQGNGNLEPNSSINDSNQQLPPYKGQMQVTEIKSEFANEAHFNSHSEPGKDNKSEHHTVPHLQDILIKRPDSDFAEKSATSHSQDVLQNVELTANGEPVIEEVLIDKSQTNGQNETEMSSFPATSSFQNHSGSESDNLSSVTTEGSADLKSKIIGSPKENSTNEPAFSVKQSNESSSNDGIKITTQTIVEGFTEGPTYVEQSTILPSDPYKTETSLINGFKSTENPEDIHNTPKNNNIGNPSDHSRLETYNIGLNGTQLKSENETDSEQKSTNVPLYKVPTVTIQPEIQNEYHTIPVAVEFSSSADGKANIERELKQENHTDAPDSATKPEGSTAGHGDESSKVTNNLNSSSIASSGQFDQRKVDETTTESRIPVTTLFSEITPNTTEKKINEQLTNKKENEAELKESTTDNKTINETNKSEINETTKSPEELSNNIKDELLDNEEFNTLIDKEYKNKESSSTDGKELLNKYPNKSQKVDKKKVKDYVKGEKTDPDKKAEVTTTRPAVTPEDLLLQKHVNGNENTFDLEYSLQNEHTTKHDGEVTVIDPNGFDGIPGVLFKPHGINNQDLRVLQTVAPDFRTEIVQNHDLETQKFDSKTKLVENKEGESKQDKDYQKFEKDYKYEKQKVSKKKDLKKKGGSVKDGKNVELDDGRKFFTEASKEDVDISPEVIKDNPETTINPSFEKITVHPETGLRIIPGSAAETTAVSEYKTKEDSTPQITHTNVFEKKTEAEGITEPSKQFKSVSEETTSGAPEVSSVGLEGGMQRGTPVDQNFHQIIDEPSVRTTSNVSPGIVYDDQSPDSVKSFDSGTTDSTVNTSSSVGHTESEYKNIGSSNATPSTVLDGISGDVTTNSSASSVGFESTDPIAGATDQPTPFVAQTILTNAGTVLEGGVAKNTTANPTIIIHGQSGNLQDGHTMRFVDSTFYNPGNSTITSVLNGTLGHSDSHTFTFTNYTTTFPNGSVVHPTIIVRGQSGTLQDGHEVRFGNGTLKTSLSNGQPVFKNSSVYRIENASVPGTLLDGHFNPQVGHHPTFGNSSGTFAYFNTTPTKPEFIIKGESGDFGNSRAYIMSNESGATFSRDFTVPSVIFRNSTVFAVENTPAKDSATTGIHELTATPQDVTLNDTIHYTHQVSPNFFSTGTAYKVNNYFGYVSKCAAGQFQCVNGTSKRGSACISLSSKCDSINDCSDGSDELGCIANGCPGNFQCADGSCLKRNLVCNGILDCSDGSDEKQCENWKCEFDEFQCPSGRCIPVVWQCDGKPDCDNHTDEYNCQTSCGNDEYLCPEGWCVPLTYKCNGVKECSNGEDEQLCDCSHEEFKCQTGGCVSTKQVCDGLDDCPDRSDEWDCVKLEPGSNQLKIRTASGNYEPVCADGWTSRLSDEVCTSLGYYSSVPIENENNSSITTETPFFTLKNGSTGNFNKKIIVNLRKSEGNCSSGKMVEIICQEFICGSRSMTDSSSVEARLVGGMGATAGQWPSVALVYNIRNFHSCTANVLTPRWILASYNCLKMGNKNLNEQDWKFFGGSTVFEAERENAETRKILSIIPHPQVKFNQFLFSNDLALVELDQSLQFTSNLGAVCLPEQEIQPRQICVTAGWGMNTPEDKSMRQQLQYLPVPTMNLTECNSTEHYSGFITDDKICAGYNSAPKALCYNEEGAPLMCVNDRGEWELQGVLSYHSNCGRGSHPSIFSSITPVADWIKKTIGNAFERKSSTATKR